MSDEKVEANVKEETPHVLELAPPEERQPQTPEQLAQEVLMGSRVVAVRMMNVAAVHSMVIISEINNLMESKRHLSQLNAKVLDDNFKVIRKSLELAALAESVLPKSMPMMPGMMGPQRR